MAKDKEPKVPEAPKPEAPPATATTPPVAEAPSAPVSDPRDEALAAMQEKLERLELLVKSNAADSVGMLQEERSRQEQTELRKEIDKGTKLRTQEAADKMFPHGKHRFLCNLPDGNGHPEIAIGADNEVDAAARYMAVCGIRSAEKQVMVQRS